MTCWVLWDPEEALPIQEGTKGGLPGGETN